MRSLLSAFTLSIGLWAQHLPVVPFQTDPDRLARSLRQRTPLLPVADCRALNLLECHPDEPSRITDIAIRWVQLDNDPELEAVLILEAKAEDSYAAYVFDRLNSWNLVGMIMCRRHRCDGNNLIRVQRLTADSPPLLLFYQDLGGSGQTILTTEAFHLRDGKLWPAFRVNNYLHSPFGLAHVERQEVLASENYIIIHTIREEPPGSPTRNTCEVRRWDRKTFTFVQVPEQRTNYCEKSSGKPITDKSFPIGIPTHR